MAVEGASLEDQGRWLTNVRSTGVPTGGAAVVAQRVAVAADPSGALKWDQATYEARAGDSTFQVSNRSTLPHNFAIEGNGITVQSKDFGGNTDHTFTVKGLPTGEYRIVCTVPGHCESSMIARLIVR